jgi:poly(3-hydroxybutyrate) depolymerase
VVARYAVVLALIAGVALVATMLLEQRGSGVVGTSTGQSSPTRTARPVTLKPRRLLISYRAWDGRRRSALVLVPASSARRVAAPWPLVISPHGRGVRPAEVAGRWGNLPSLYGFVVVCPAGEGVRVHNDPFGAPGDVADLARMPAIVRRVLPWLHIDDKCVYAVGSSMGGLEALLLAARHPDSLAAAVAMDAVVDLRRRYREMLSSTHSGDRSQDKLCKELGGTPSQVPACYRQRSPMTYLPALARGRVALLVWWSRADKVVVGQARMQSGLFVRRLRQRNPRALVREVVTDLPHNAAFSARVGLPAVVRFLRPNGHWRRLTGTR